MEFSSALYILGCGKKIIINIWRFFQKELGIKVHMNPAYHPQTDEQLERNIQTLEVMLMICILDWKGSWGKYLPLA